MLRTILSISGRPGLYKLVNQGKNMLIVESLTDGKRIPTYARDRVISLGDVSIYTEGEGDIPLPEVFEKVYAKNSGAAVDLTVYDSKGLREYFGEILPDFDRERVNTSDIKKLFQWYNILIAAGFDKFVADEPKDEDKEAAPEA